MFRRLSVIGAFCIAQYAFGGNFDVQALSAFPLGYWNTKEVGSTTFFLDYVYDGEEIYFKTNYIDFAKDEPLPVVDWGDGVVTTNGFRHTYSTRIDDCKITLYGTLERYGHPTYVSSDMHPPKDARPMQSNRVEYNVRLPDGYILNSITCSGVRKIEFRNQTKLEYLGASAFYQEVHLEDMACLTNTNIRDFRYGCFACTIALTNIFIPRTIDRAHPFGNDCFAWCGIKSFGNSGFMNLVTNISGYSVYDTREYIFRNSGLENLDGFENVQAINVGYCFANCLNLKTANLPSCKSIPSGYVFSRCSSLGDTSGFNSDVQFGSHPFDYSGITNSTCDFNYLQSEMFSNCKSLTSISIPDRFTAIPYGMCSGCSALQSLVGMHNGIVSIGQNSFKGCTSLTNLVGMSSGITSIGNSAFSGCTGLKNLNGITPSWQIANATTSTYVFDGCSGLEDMSAMATCTNLSYYSNYMFENCTSLKNIVIPASCVYISASAFGSTSAKTSQNVTAIYSYASTPPTITSTTLTKLPSGIPIYVPSSSVASYKNASYWSSVKEQIQAFP